MKQVLTFLLTLPLCAQTPVTATVTDVEGRPLSNVTVHGVNAANRQGQAKFNGSYTGQSSAARIVFRANGFQSVVVAPTQGLRIVMRPVQPPPFPDCAYNPSNYLAEYRKETFLQFLAAKPDKFRQDEDYRENVYLISTVTGRHAMIHGWGPNYSHGTPGNYFLFHVFQEYAERTFEKNGIVIIDARGTTKDGKLWRSFGVPMELASYQTDDPDAAKQLDAILDSACLMERLP